MYPCSLPEEAMHGPFRGCGHYSSKEVNCHGAFWWRSRVLILRKARFVWLYNATSTFSNMSAIDTIYYFDQEVFVVRIILPTIYYVRTIYDLLFLQQERATYDNCMCSTPIAIQPIVWYNTCTYSVNHSRENLPTNGNRYTFSYKSFTRAGFDNQVDKTKVLSDRKMCETNIFKVTNNLLVCSSSNNNK